MKTINFTVEGQKLDLVDSDVFLRTDSRNFLKYQIQFDDSYNDLQKIVIFTSTDDFGEKVRIKQVYDDTGINKVPLEVLDCNHFYISVYTLGEQRITTNECLVIIGYSGFISDFEETGLTKVNKINDLSRIYDATYDYLNYDYAYDYFERRRSENVDDEYKSLATGCSAFYANNMMGRNLDWLYSEMCNCIIRTKDTIGVAGALPDFTRVFAKDKTYTDTYTILPFFLQDGVNKSGLACSTLTTPNITDSSKPTGEVRDNICSLMLVRYILDNFESIEQAYEYLREHVEVYFPKSLLDLDFNQHWLLSDATGRVGILEIVDLDDRSKGDEIFILNEFPAAIVASNFHVTNVEYNDDLNVYTPATQHGSNNAVTVNHIHPLGAGLERHNIMIDAISSIDSVVGCKNLLEFLKYSKTYSQGDGAHDITDIWYTEFCGEESPDGPVLRCDTPTSGFTDILKKAHEKYVLRSRNPNNVFFGTWNTNHSIVYDLVEKELHIATQEEFNDWKRIPFWEEYEYE